MEEDTGKSLHVGGTTGRIHGASYSLLDYNRSGIPLIEVVSKPIEVPPSLAPAIARAYVTELRELVRALGISAARMELGQLRCDANVSLKPTGSTRFGTRTETKNVNSLRSVERAIVYEIRRQAAVLAEGGRVVQETRHWHEDTGETTSVDPRSKPRITATFPSPTWCLRTVRDWVDALRMTLPERPSVSLARLQEEWGFSDLEMRDVLNAGAVELVAATVAAGSDAAGAKKWWLGEIARLANERGVALDVVGITPADVARIQELVGAGSLNDKLARQVIEGIVAGEGSSRRRGIRAWARRRV